MSTVIENIKSNLVSVSMGMLSGALTFFLGLLYHYLLVPVIVQIMPNLKTPTLLSLLGLLIILFAIFLFLTIPYIIHLRRRLHNKPKLKDYDYIEDPGFYIHKKTKEKYCGNCIDKHDKLHRLSFDAQRGLICRPCGNSYVSPQDYESAWKQATQNDKNS